MPGKLPLEIEFDECGHITTIYVTSPEDAKQQAEDLRELYGELCPACTKRRNTPEQAF